MKKFKVTITTGPPDYDIQKGVLTSDQIEKAEEIPGPIRKLVAAFASDQFDFTLSNEQMTIRIRKILEETPEAPF